MNAIILTAVLGVIMMITGAFGKSPTLPNKIAVAGIILLLIVNGIELYSGQPFFDINMLQMLNVNSSSLIFLQVIFGCTLFYFLLSGKDIEKVGIHIAEYYALMFFILCGLSLLCTFNTLLILFLGVEIMSIPQYVLAGAEKRNLKSNEAALKYFLMGSFTTGIMLMGIAFVYGATPNASFYVNQIMLGTGTLTPMMAIGMVFLLVGMAFKVSAAPFHFWTPDVYDGTPTVFTSFMSTVIKAASFFAFVRLFHYAFGEMHAQWQTLIILLIIATLFFGNITAVFQQSIKRMLAYSSIAQAGFMLFAVFTISNRGNEGLLVYAAAYCLASIGLFAILAKAKDESIDGFNGLSKTNPIVALCATIFLLSLTGIPLTAGFQGKFLMLLAAAESSPKIWLIIVAVIFAAISSYYYFRVIIAMYFKEPQGEVLMEGRLTEFHKWMLIIIAALIIIIGVYPELLIGWLYY